MMAGLVYKRENVVTVYIDFTNAVPAAANPTTVVVNITDPAGTPTQYTNGTTPAITNPSTGRFELDYDTTSKALGWYYCEWLGTGTIIASDDIWFKVVDPKATKN